MTNAWFAPNWPAAPGVRALITTRAGGVSYAPYDNLNLGDHVGDDAAHVAQNRARLRQVLPSEPVWLKQVHGVEVICADEIDDALAPPVADAAVARQVGTVCAVMTADCLPVLFASTDGEVVAAAHAGWRGLCAGVLEHTLRAMNCSASKVTAYFGPAIGAANFEVGPEVRAAFVEHDPEGALAFRAAQGDRWLADIYALARQRLVRQGVSPQLLFGGNECTVAQTKRYFSYRRDGVTGRMASLIWRQSQD